MKDDNLGISNIPNRNVEIERVSAGKLRGKDIMKITLFISLLSSEVLHSAVHTVVLPREMQIKGKLNCRPPNCSPEKN